MPLDPTIGLFPSPTVKSCSCDATSGDRQEVRVRQWDAQPAPDRNRRREMLDVGRSTPNTGITYLNFA